MSLNVEQGQSRQRLATPQLMYRIAEAKGIHGGEKSISEPVIEDIDINPLLMAPLTQAPTIQRRTVVASKRSAL